MNKGRCECGQIQYEFDGEILDFSHCHCSQCRRLHGAAYATFAGIKRDSFRYVAGESQLGTYASSAGSDRKFCKNCGSNILVELKSEADMLYLSMGTVDGNPSLPSAYHIYVGSKAPWHEITDEFEQYEIEPPE